MFMPFNNTTWPHKGSDELNNIKKYGMDLVHLAQDMLL
jgi:hypothetical protein